MAPTPALPWLRQATTRKRERGHISVVFTVRNFLQRFQDGTVLLNFKSVLGFNGDRNVPPLPLAGGRLA